MQKLVVERLGKKIPKITLWVIVWVLVVWGFLGAPLPSEMMQNCRDVRAYFSPPQTVIQIGGDGAVVVTADTPYEGSRFTHGKSLRYQGVAHVGEHLCVTVVGVGDPGILTFPLPHGYIALSDNPPGHFQPDTSANGCDKIATEVKLPDPNGAWALADRRLFQPVVHPWRVSIGRVAALFALAFIFAYRRRKRNFAPRKPVPLATLQEIYAGFAVREGDFEAEGKKVYRVNSDGYRVDLKKWHFDVSTGEFFRIDRKVKGHVIFTTKSYSERFIAFAPTIAGAVLGWLVVLVCGVSTVTLGETAIREGGAASTWCPIFAVVMAVGVWLLLIPRSEASIGPQPLGRIAPEFGTQQPHGTSADEGMI